MARYKKYNGPDKYHFRIYKKNGNHPFIVVAVSEIYINGHYYLSGYMITHNVQKYLDYPEKYVQLNSNPNPNDDSPSFLCKTRISNMKDSCFSKPYSNWHLNCKDIAEIEKLEETKKES